MLIRNQVLSEPALTVAIKPPTDSIGLPSYSELIEQLAAALQQARARYVPIGGENSVTMAGASSRLIRDPPQNSGLDP
jgi:hypothetical protein